MVDFETAVCRLLALGFAFGLVTGAILAGLWLWGWS